MTAPSTDAVLSLPKRLDRGEWMSPAERDATGLLDFCSIVGVSRSTAFAEVRAGRLKASYIGRRLIITAENRRAWLASLPTKRIA